MNLNDFFNIMYTLVISYFGAIAKEINDKTKENESLSKFFGEIILHGFSGWITGLTAIKCLGLDDFTWATIFAGVGGLFGFDLLRYILNIALTMFKNAKNIKMDDKDTKF